MEIGNWEINYFPDFNFQREIENARNALYFTRILYRGNIFLCPGGMGNVVFYLYLHHGGRRAKMTEATQTTFFRDFFGKEMSENSGLATQYLLLSSIQRRSTGVDFSPLEQANKSLLHALTVVGFIRFPLATRMRRLSKPKLHSYSVFACARLAVAAVRVVELQLRRSLDRFGGPSLRHRACGA